MRRSIRIQKLFCLLLAAVFCVAAFSSCNNASGNFDPATGEWILSGSAYLSSAEPDDGNDVFYEIFVGSFSDSDGDGVGDLRGIINRLDYLNDGDPDSGKSLGIEGIWLTPIFRSSSYHKYDADNYEAIDEKFGTMDDLKELVSECHKRNIKIILDLVLNHTGRNHQWFSKFRSARTSEDASDPYYDYYTTPETAEAAGISGARFGYVSGTTLQYECNFDSGMPELNYENQDVRNEMLRIAKSYLALGVDGFRFDAAKYIYYGNPQKNAEFWEWFCGALKEDYPSVYTVAEVWDSDPVTMPYTKATSVFNFNVSQAEGLLSATAKKGNVYTYTSYVKNYLNSLQAQGGNARYTPFISNHDTDRAAGYNTLASGFAHMAANLLILGPGSPFLYYGEEIGMKGTRGSANTDANRRLAMLWGDEDTVKDPTGSTYDASKQTNGTVKEQIASADSLYSHYKKLIALRKANPVIARGEYVPIEFEGIKFGGFASVYEGQTVIVLHNTSTDPVTVTLDETVYAGLNGKTMTLSAAVGFQSGTASLDGKTLTVDGQTSVLLRAE